ncbi:CerR family C-terminal domain-containing protein [Marinobacteraceae bacterium S3BR75-40.1]
MTTTTPRDPEGTRETLLRAASDIFADKGFQVARVQDIARRADTNLSAINYHFGSKQGLYEAVLEYQARSAIDRYPLLPSNAQSLSPERRFRCLVGNLLRRFIAPRDPSLMARLMAREMANPTRALDQLVEHVSKPQLAQMSRIVAELMGSDSEPEVVRRCAFSIMGQCLVYLFGRPVIGRIEPELYADDASLERLADHITAFSLAALRHYGDYRELSR